jgi:hypothetical protein
MTEGNPEGIYWIKGLSIALVVCIAPGAARYTTGLRKKHPVFYAPKNTLPENAGYRLAPHPPFGRPLPKGEAKNSVLLPLHKGEAKNAVLLPLPKREAKNAVLLPLPWGEGRGEGERDSA